MKIAVGALLCVLVGTACGTRTTRPAGGDVPRTESVRTVDEGGGREGVVITRQGPGGDIADEIVAAFVAAFNTGSAETMAAHLRDALHPDDLARDPLAARLVRYRALHERLGRLEPVDLNVRSGTAHVVMRAEKVSEPVAFVFTYDAAPPNRLRGITMAERSEDVTGGQPPPERVDVGALVPNPAGLVANELAGRIDEMLSGRIAEGMAGAVLVKHRGRIILQRGYGMADRARGVPYDSGTVVQIGSNTKDFTFVAIMQLVERGVIGLDDPIGAHLPGVPADRSGITVRHLLQHTSGLVMGVGGDFEPVSREALLARAWTSALASEPGARRQYSNLGYSLLGAIIELKSGISYEAFVTTNILDPLGLRNTGGVQRGFDRGRIAHGYRPDGSDTGIMLERGMDADGAYWNLRANGGLLSTVGDMMVFYDALRSNRLIRAAHRGLLYDPAEGTMLAGSDGISMFAYLNEPDLELEVLIGTSTPMVPAPRLAQRLAGLVR